MHLEAIEIFNIRSLRGTSWKAPGPNRAGWHVILGENGSGKSSFVRAVALTLAGPKEAAGLRQDWNEWLTKGESDGKIKLFVDFCEECDRFSGPGRPPTNWFPGFGVQFERVGDDVILQEIEYETIRPQRHIWGGVSGWFSCAYGPFRRFSGGSKEYEKLYYSHPKLARHLSAFSEDIALSESLDWLQRLKFSSYEGAGQDAELLDRIKEFLNQPDLLPHGTRLDSVTSKGVLFVDGSGEVISVLELSDGFRSVLSMTFELIRQLCNAFDVDSVFDEGNTTIQPHGVVLIDEIDVHLHPSWQRRIGNWLTTRFPNIQFIVTTHSPFVCQAAGNGSVFRLAAPGSDEVSGPIVGDELNRLLYGDILDAYSTSAFGADLTRSDQSNELLDELAELSMRRTKGQLAQEEEAKYAEILTLIPPTDADRIEITQENSPRATTG